ncbi:hypothetical protein GCM10022244_34200 [Streptomyces gulbargensis]|uniref:Zinc ribbon domain-containing protein n=1 Tax=Streptomyces gulbargensis TaxID=364901 RepID=A0ABP7MJ83_9ACTN
MDYCHPCRRHLNGALACAGCGTPAQELRQQAPRPSGETAAPGPYAAPAAYGSYGTPYGTPAAPSAEPTGPAEPELEVPPEHVYELDVVAPPRPAPGGRRAAREGARRGKRGGGRRGRAVLVGTLGLVLAAGTMTVLRTVLAEPDDGGAATAVREERPVATSPEAVPEPDPTGTPAQPDGSGPDIVTDAPSAGVTRARQVSAGTATGHGTDPKGADSGTGAGTGSGTGTGSGAGTGSGSGTGEGAGDAPQESPTVTGPPSPTAPAVTPPPSATATAPGTPAPTSAPGDPGPTPGDTTAPAPTRTAPPTPTPTPAPSEPECTRFLWWCV